MNRAKRYLLSNWPEILIATTTLAASLLVFLFSELKAPNDDQFILFRYIDNLAAGKGFVFNDGEYVLGSTTPLFTLLAALLKVPIPTTETPVLVAMLNMSLLTAAGFFFVRLARHFVPLRYAVLAGLIFSFNLSKTIPEGMETPLFLLGMLAFFYYLFNKRFVASAVLLAVCVLTRPDAGLIALVAGIYWLQHAGLSNAIRYTTISLACAMPWFVFATAYFGSFIPQSLTTKLHSEEIYDLSAIQAAKIQLAHISRLFWGKIFDPENLPLQSLLNMLPVLALAALGGLRNLGRNSWPLFAVPLMYFASLAISNPIIFPWYLSEMEPVWILIAVMGAVYISGKFRTQIVAWFVMALLIVGPLYGWLTLTVTDGPGTKMAAFDIGQYIKDHKFPDDTVGLADIGIVGYVSEARIEDFIGLVNTYAVEFYPVSEPCKVTGSIYTVPPQLVMHTQPDWLVSGVEQMSPCLLGSDWFKDTYDRVQRAGGAILWKKKES